MSDSRHYPDPVQHPEVHGFLRAMAEKPGDQLVRLQFADWLEEHGYDNAAKWQREFAALGKYPNHEPSGSMGWLPNSATQVPGYAHAGLPAHFQNALLHPEEFTRVMYPDEARDRAYGTVTITDPKPDPPDPHWYPMLSEREFLRMANKTPFKSRDET